MTQLLIREIKEGNIKAWPTGTEQYGLPEEYNFSMKGAPILKFTKDEKYQYMDITFEQLEDCRV